MIELLTLLAIALPEGGNRAPDPTPAVHPPAVVVLDDLEDMYDPVLFDHLGHAGMADMGDGCVVCHHHSPDDTTHPACRECHALGPSPSLLMPGLKGAYHRQCLSCHTEWSHRAACNICHLPKESVGALRADEIHGPFLEFTAVHTPGAYVFHTQEDAPVITFRHDEHARIYGLSCADCHQGESCSRCHDHGSGTTPRAHSDSRPLCFGCHARASQQDCRFCHHAAAQPETFDHATEAGWALEPYHTGLACANCHGAADAFATPSRNCYGCHSLIGIKGFDHGTIGPEESCLECHGNVADLATSTAHSHTALENGCRACHNPESTNQPFFLIESGPDLCFTCHDGVSKCYEHAATRHSAPGAGNSCTSCHEPHGSNHPFLLPLGRDELCLDCHDQSVITHDGRALANVGAWLATCSTRHWPMTEEGCTACHEVHGSANTRLLRNAYPSTFYAPLTEHAYDLCFRCHDRHLLATEPAAMITGFRDGDRNLHALHIDRERGRTCRACHDPHASDLPHLIRENVPYQRGLWSFPMRYEWNAEGGRCAPACHEPLEYRRGQIVAGPKSAVQ